jgi:hypothetical protein
LLVTAAPFCRGGPSSSTTERCKTQRLHNMYTCQAISLLNMWDVISSRLRKSTDCRGLGVASRGGDVMEPGGRLPTFRGTTASVFMIKFLFILSETIRWKQKIFPKH